MDSLRTHRDYLKQAWQDAQAAPLSARRALLVALLIDAQVDRLFAVQGERGDVLAFRAHIAAGSSAVGLIMALASQRDVRLMTEAVAVPLAEYAALPVEDFMVSLYNDHSVQRLRLATADGGRHDMMDTLRAAISALG